MTSPIEAAARHWPAPDERDAAWQREAQRQAAVIAAWRDAGADAHLHLAEARLAADAVGLEAYRGHARAQARKLVAALYPTLAAMIGIEALDMLAGRLWRRHPPSRGDLGEWGEGLAALVEQEEALRAWPWLADSARLDWACHQSARSEDAPGDTATLLGLGQCEPAALRLVLVPSVRLLHSDWPVAALRHAHALPAEEQAEAAERALAEGQGGWTIVWRRPDWQIVTRVIPSDWADWMRPWLQHGLDQAGPGTAASDADAPDAPTLASLLEAMAPGFDFTAWLTAALREGWLWRIERVAAPITDRPAGS